MCYLIFCARYDYINEACGNYAQPWPRCMDKKFPILLPANFDVRTVCFLKFIYVQSNYMYNENKN